jgi:uncharacterized membrane protein
VANPGNPSRGYFVGLLLLGLFYVVAGINHFIHPAMYIAIMPPYIPWPSGCVYLTGVAEVMGGVGVLIPKGFVFPRTRKTAAWGLVALLICIWPVHFNMCLHPGDYPSVPLWAIWLRLPLQIPLIGWAWIYTRG